LSAWDRSTCTRQWILFANGAQVNVSGLVASSLDISNQTFTNAAVGSANPPSLRQQGLRDGRGRCHADGQFAVRIMLLAPTVTNNGVIRTPDGQTILARARGSI